MKWDAPICRRSLSIRQRAMPIGKISRGKAEKAKTPSNRGYLSIVRALSSLYPSHQQKHDQNNDDETEPAASVISGPVKWPSPDAAETSKQGDDQNNQYYGPDAHRIDLLMMPEQGQQDDDRQRHAKQPKQCASSKAHDFLHR
jgi:hypothetical protein